MTEKPLDFGNAHSAFADSLAGIERHGPVTHLLFATEQQAIDSRNRQIITARLIVPTALLVTIARQLTQSAGPAIDDSPHDLTDAVH
jgi:hypothetical protein